MRSLRAHFGHTRLLNHWPTARGVCRLLARNLHANPAKLLNRVPILWRIFSPTIPTHAPHEPPLAPFLIELLAGSLVTTCEIGIPELNAAGQADVIGREITVQCRKTKNE